jgi:hypothetical protein
MRRLTLLILLLVCVTAPALARDQQTTAYHALRTVARQLDRTALSRVISVTGMNGDPQPTEWTILLADRTVPGGIREVQVANGRIVSNGVPRGGVVGSAQSAMFPANRLNLDSNGAFSVASYTANTSHVNFDSASYTLRTNERGVPFWVVTLQDNEGRSLGRIHINATKGNIARVEGMFRGANMAQAEPQPRPPRVTRRTERIEEEEVTDDEYVDFSEDGEVVAESTTEDEDEEIGEDDNIVKAEIKRMFRRSKRGVQRVFERARQSFRDFVDS